MDKSSDGSPVASTSRCQGVLDVVDSMIEELRS